MTRVFPDPAPARTSCGPSPWVTAAICSGFSSRLRSRGARTALTIESVEWIAFPRRKSMRSWTLRPLLVCLALTLALGCALPPRTAPEAPAAGGQPASLAVQQQMAVLAFVAYLGEELTGSDDKVEGELYQCLVDQLAVEPLTKDKWTRAWGPAVYKLQIPRY